MKYLVLFLFAVTAFASEETKELLKTQLELLKKDQQIAMDGWKSNHPNWRKRPQDEYTQFFEEWTNTGLQKELELYKKAGASEPSLQLTEQQISFIEAKAKTSINVQRMLNEYAKANPQSDIQAVRKKLENWRKVSLCTQSSDHCSGLSARQMALVQALKKRDEYLAAQEEGFKKDDNWSNEGDDTTVKNKNTLIDSKVQQDLDLAASLCEKFPRDEEYCLTSEEKDKIREDGEKEKCLVARVKALYDAKWFGKPDSKSKEIIKAGHEAQWDALADKTNACQALLEQDKQGKSAEQPVAQAPRPVEAISSSEKSADEGSKYKLKDLAATCTQWVPEIPRRLLTGCGGTCFGYVICERPNNGGKFVRMATCAPKRGDCNMSPVDCVKDPSRGNKKPKAEEDDFISERLRYLFINTDKAKVIKE